MADLDPLTADFAQKHPDSFARVLSRADASDMAIILGQLSPAVAAGVLARLPGPQLGRLLDSGRVTPEQWLVDASFDDAVTMLSRIPRERRLAMVNSLSDRTRRQQLLRHQQYPVHSVGALVSDVAMRIRLDTSAAEVVKEFREMHSDEPSAMVVVDTEGNYHGLLNLWRLLASEMPTGQIKDYVRKVDPIYPETAIVDAMHNEDWLKQNWLPVVDQRQRVLGGVSRARLFQAGNAAASAERGSSNILLDLMTELVYMLSAVLESALVRRRRS